MSHTRKTRTADSLSPAAITRPALLHPGCQGTPARRDGTAKHRSTWECRGLNKPQCVWGGGEGLPYFLVQDLTAGPIAPALSPFIVFPSESYNSLFH